MLYSTHSGTLQLHYVALHLESRKIRAQQLLTCINWAKNNQRYYSSLCHDLLPLKLWMSKWGALFGVVYHEYQSTQRTWPPPCTSHTLTSASGQTKTSAYFASFFCWSGFILIFFNFAKNCNRGVKQYYYWYITSVISKTSICYLKSCKSFMTSPMFIHF